MAKKRTSRKEIMAEHLNLGFEEIEWYQERGEKIKVFATDLDYYCPCAPGEKPPAGWDLNWEEETPRWIDEHPGWKMYHAKAER